MNRIVSVFFLMMFIIGTDIFIASPLLPTLRDAFGVSVESSGWMVSAFSLGYALFALVAGPLSDGWNRKKAMIAGMAGFGLFTLLCGYATDYWTMLLFRFLAGVSGALASPQIWAAIPQLVPPNKVLQAMGIATAGLAVSQMFGVPIGSYLAGFGWSTPFIVIGACSFVIVLLIAVVLPSIPPVLSEQKAHLFLNATARCFMDQEQKLLFSLTSCFNSEILPRSLLSGHGFLTNLRLALPASEPSYCFLAWAIR